MILTGLSGSGKGSVLKTFEDLGFYCVDNLPVALIPTFSELYVERRGRNRARCASGGRARGRADRKASRNLPQADARASGDAGFRRSERRSADAPLQRDAPAASAGQMACPLREGIRAERRRMAPIRRLADVVIDTTQVQRPRAAPVHHRIVFRNPRPPAAADFRRELRISVRNSVGCGSGVRRALSAESAFRAALAPVRGKNPKVARYIRSFPQTGQFLRRIESLLAYLIPHYIRRREKLSDGRARLHRRPAPLGDAGGSDSSKSEEAGLCDESGSPRSGEIGT